MNTSFKQIYILKLFIAFKMAYSCCFTFRGNLDFPEFLQKSFETSTNYWIMFCFDFFLVRSDPVIGLDLV